MVVTDPIADMLTRVRNALIVRHDEVLIPASKTKNAIAEILLNEGFITACNLEDVGNCKFIKITLKYGPNGEKVIQGLKRISKPGLRVYAESNDIPRVLNGLGIAIVSTNKGIMTDKEARNQNVGGEVLAFVW